MEPIDELAKSQELMGKEIQRLITNSKKDSPSVKTEQYYVKKNGVLEALWDTIKENHKKIVEKNDVNHVYFKEKYYDQLSIVYKDALKYINDSKIKYLEIQTKSVQHIQVPSRLKEAEVRIVQINRNLQEIQQELETPRPNYRYQFLLDKISKQWNAVSDIYIELQVQGLDNTIKQSMLDLEKEYELVVQHIQSKIQESSKEKVCNISLPQIKLPTFDGLYEDWITFRDIFVKVVHDNKAITDTEKMQYLKTNIRGEAARIIQHLAISNQNYNTAWSILSQRYSNNRLIVSKLLDKVLDIPVIQYESAYKIKQLHDTVMECIEAINNLNIDTSSWGPIIGRVICRKWDHETNKLYEQSIKNPHEVQDFHELLQFLRARFQSLEAISTAQKKTQFKDESRVFSESNKYSKAASESCKYCQESHTIYHCAKFKALSPTIRLKAAKERKICLNCLNHDKNLKCNSLLRCRICKQQHHTFVHVNSMKEPISRSPRSNQEATSSHVTRHNGVVMLATALIRVRNSHGGYEYLRALIDPGSQCTFITEEAATLLTLPRNPIRAEVTGLGAGQTHISKWQIETIMKPRFSSNFELRVSSIVLPQLTKTMPSENIEVNLANWANDIIADPNLNKPGPIDIILGAREYGQIILEGLRKTEEGLLGQKTEFGWILSGNTITNIHKKFQVLSITTTIEEDKQLTKFWEIEEICQSKPQSLNEDDQYCEQYYEETTVRNKDGTYTVRLPFNGQEKILGTSRPRALARLLQLEKRMTRDDTLGNAYSQFMQEYEQLGHMEPVAEREDMSQTFYIPHQPVIKESSITTKLRVVFDASSKTSSGISLNNTMFSGPRLQQDLSDILLRWRIHRVVITADIEKMYRQIRIHPDDQDYQRILWRPERTSQISEYRLSTVTYGTTAAPYLAIKTIQKLARDEAKNYPKAAQVTTNDFYVDDLLSGSDTIDEAIQLQTNLIQMFKSGGFKLRKWSSNKVEVLHNLPDDMIDYTGLEISNDDTRKSLGIHWAPYDDTFRFKTKLSANDKLTKRVIISEVAKLFDPLGWLAPVTIKAKLLIQELWLNNLNWDDPVPCPIETKWKTFHSELQDVEKISIPRWTHQVKNSQIELHGFCDASEKAYGAVVYMKTTDSVNGVRITLLAAKSKVAPVRMKTTLPRLELCAAVLLSRLVNKIVSALLLQHVPLNAWTDSMIVLAWIKGDPVRWKTFVANRISEIVSLISTDKWHHVRTEDNPADIVSRGINPSNIVNNKIWWFGPEWVRTYDRRQLENSIIPVTKEEARMCHIVSNIQQDEEGIHIIERFSSLTKMMRVISQCKRFTKYCRKTKKPSQNLTVEELNQSLLQTVKIVQKTYFHAEIQALHKKSPLNRTSKVLNTNPFLDTDGIMRVGGRLQNSTLSYSQKHPMILPYSSKLSELIILDAHHKSLHGGNSLTLSITRKQFWIINGKRAVRTIINRCIKCTRFKAQTANQQMGNLPAVRVVQSHPFLHSGVDYAGPIQIRTTKGRGYKSYKGYIAVFVCLATKAVHLEVVSDMSSDTFLAAFRRFVSRRGHCSHIYSDNGTNFVGASKVLQKEIYNTIQSAKITDTLSSFGTQWHFIPPASPHFGGIWEAAVKSMKFHLKRVIGETSLTYEETTTLIQQIEACLNSRPLSPLSNDIDDLNVLTPGHFLVGREIVSIPDPITTNINSNLIERWKIVQKIKKDFWKSWSTEYLNQLQQRYKWQTPQKQLKIGDLVLIKEQHINPSKWPLARITEVHPGRDNNIRVVTVRRAEGNTTKRSIHQLIPVLPTEEKPKAATQKRQPKTRWKILLIALVFLSTLQRTVAQQYTLNYPQSGIFIEHIGHAKIDRGTFRIEIRIDKNKILNDTSRISGTVNQTNDFCEEMMKLTTSAHQCTMLVHHLQEKEKQLRWITKGIEGVHLKRTTRGILGTFLTSVFGVNDEVYMDIEDLDKNQKELLKASQHQTKFMLHALATFNDTEVRINNQLNIFQQKINQGIDTINRMKKWYNTIDENKISIHFLGSYQIVSNCIDELLEHYQKILDIHYHRGHLYEIISPAHIEDILISASKKLPSNINIISYPVLRTVVEHSKQFIHICGYFVMTEINDFPLIKSTATPLKFEERVYWSLDLTNGILAIDYNSQLYFELREEEFKDSINIGQNVYVCSPITIKSIEISPTCIIDEIYQRTENTSCRASRHPIDTIVWKQLFTPNAWIAITPNKTKIAIVCNGIREDIMLNQTAIVKISPNCIIKTKKNILTTRRFESVTVLESSFRSVPPKLNFFLPTTESPSISEEEPVINSINHLSDLDKEERSINRQLQDVNWITVKHHVIATSTTISILLVICLAVLFILYLRRRQKSASTNKDSTNAKETTCNDPLYAIPTTTAKHEEIHLVPLLSTRGPRMSNLQDEP